MKRLLLILPLLALVGWTKVVTDVQPDGTVIEKRVEVREVEQVYLTNGRKIECIHYVHQLTCNWEKYNKKYGGLNEN